MPSINNDWESEYFDQETDTWWRGPWNDRKYSYTETYVRRLEALDQYYDGPWDYEDYSYVDYADWIETSRPEEDSTRWEDDCWLCEDEYDDWDDDGWDDDGWDYAIPEDYGWQRTPTEDYIDYPFDWCPICDDIHHRYWPCRPEKKQLAYTQRVYKFTPEEAWNDLVQNTPSEVWAASSALRLHMNRWQEGKPVNLLSFLEDLEKEKCSIKPNNHSTYST